VKLLAFAFVGALAMAQPQAPNHWAGCGSQYSSSDSPRWSGWCSVALEISTSQKLYSYSLYQIIPVPGKAPTTSTITGGWLDLKDQSIGRFGSLHVGGLLAAGAAVSSTATTGAFAGGGLGIWVLPSKLTVEFGVIQNKAAANARPQILLGFGRTW
jgi:hypothetical protein